MKLRQSKAAKITAAVMFFITLALAFVAGFSAVVMADNNVYFDGGIYMREDVARWIFQTKAHTYYNYAYALADGGIPSSTDTSYKAWMSRENNNLSVTVTKTVGNSTDKVIFESYPTDSDYQYKFTSVWDYNYYQDDTLQHIDFEITAYLQPELVAKDAFYYAMPLADFFIGARYAVIWTSVIAALFALALLIFLMCAAGHRNGHYSIYETAFDRVPLDLLCALYFFGFLITVWLAEELMYGTADIVGVIYIIAAVILWLVLAVLLLLTLAVRVKARTFFKNTLILRIIKLLWRGVLLAFHVLEKIPLWWKTALGFVLWTALELLFLAVGYYEYLPFWFLTRPLLIAFLVYCVLMLRRLQKAGEQLADGNTAYRVDTKYMLPDMRRHGENLNNLSAGLNHAVEERMKSERMKSELITNVSHDIKTPLTSIINYVDLLKINGLDSPDAPEYLEVLDNQSARLKKLTEDLIEASKASSGCVNFTLEPTDVNVLLTQALGEYEERLREAHIEPILQCNSDSALIMADGRLLWRVFDNLFSNIRKYAMPSTRAYFSSRVVGDDVVITFRNISDSPLNVDADELTERFVRGDTSRHTDGSGLGMSIARSLTELQGGTFDITVDGDLFKVTLTFSAQAV